MTEDRAESGALLRRIAHDIRSPIGVIAHALEEIGRDKSNDLADDQANLLKLATRSLGRLEHWAQRLDVLGMLRGSELKLNPTFDDLGNAVDAAFQQALQNERRREVTTEWLKPQHALPLFIDSQLLRLAFTEILGNAIRYAQSKVHVGVKTGDGLLCLIITNDLRVDGNCEGKSNPTTGPQLAPQASVPLGWGIAKRLIEAHGGKLAKAIEPIKAPLVGDSTQNSLKNMVCTCRLPAAGISRTPVLD